MSNDNCEILYKQNKNNTYKYCIKHRGYQPIGTKMVKCVDCGKFVEVDARNNTKDKCQECYEKYRKKRKSETQRARRIKNEVR